jgi:hypothetical protein
VLGRLDDDEARRCRTRPPGAAGDLVELARLEQAVAGAVELRQPGEDDGADRDVDPTPSVSVPQMTFSSPVWASCSISRR